MVHRIGGIMGIWIALGVVAAAVGVAVVVHGIATVIARLRLRWSLRKMHFCRECGVLLGSGERCLRCERTPAGEEPASLK